jgi:putative peptidoglycan binding protein
MALASARFRGDPILERIRSGDTSAYLRFGAQGDAVRAVQFALIDLGSSIPNGATGNFGPQTSAAVVQFKTDHALVPNDPVVGIGTMTALDDAWALPFADRDEWLSWQTRPIREFNFTRRNELDRRNSGRQFTLNPLSAWLPGAFKDAMLRGITELLDPRGSPVGAFSPSATWGASPLDLFHCHVVLDIANGQTPSWSPLRAKAEAIHARMLAMMREADRHGPEGTPPWTAAYRNLILAPGQAGALSFTDAVADVLNGLLANSARERQTIKLVWHTFEHPPWRPVEVASDDPRRSWWNDVAPVPTGVTHTGFPSGAFGANVFQLIELGFLIDQDLVLTVLGQTRTEAAALVNLDKARIDAVS